MIYLSRLLKGLPVKVTRIASGVPIGSSLEFLDETTIGRAIISRQEL
jgi:recombination protein RecR